MPGRDLEETPETNSERFEPVRGRHGRRQLSGPMGA